MPKGTLADLNEKLQKKGYFYQYKAGQKSYSDTGKAIYKNEKGEKRLLKRIAKGEPARWLPRPQGATSWLARTHQTPDTWQVFKRKRKR